MRFEKPILLVEDSTVNTPATEYMRDDPGLGDPVFSVTTLETLTYLRTKRQQRPCVVLLAVNEENDDELATLRTIKQDEQLRSIPVIVLGPSGDSRMVDESFGLGAAGYIVKSPDHSEWSTALHTLYQYWSLSELPK